MGRRRDFAAAFKGAVERNFDESAEVYDLFEEKHHLFETLTRKQLELIAPDRPERILDVGCGTGISTFALHKDLEEHSPTIYAIDISEGMLLNARQRCKGLPGLYFLRGDAEHLTAYFRDTFDAIFYTASIFLLPRYFDSLRQASQLLVSGGVLALSYYEGLFEQDGSDAITSAFPELRYQFGAVPLDDLRTFLESIPEMSTLQVDYRFEVGGELLFDFLSIPAQSAGIYPKIPYLERIPRIRDFCATLTEKIRPLFMGWKFLISRKE